MLAIFFWVGCSKRWACCCRKSNNSKSVFLAKAAWVDSTLENPDQKLVFAFPKYENYTQKHIVAILSVISTRFWGEVGVWVLFFSCMHPQKRIEIEKKEEPLSQK